jgi:hypothetical protein
MSANTRHHSLDHHREEYFGLYIKSGFLLQVGNSKLSKNGNPEGMIYISKVLEMPIPLI